MEIITGVERRRRWRCNEKLWIMVEVERPGASFTDVARRHKADDHRCAREDGSSLVRLGIRSAANSSNQICRA